MKRGLVVPWTVVALLVVCAALVVALRSARDRAYRAGMRADSLEVAADTTRVRHLRELDLWQRRAQQRPEGPAVVVRPVLVVDTVRLVDTVPVVAVDSVRQATFTRHQPPVRLDATVRMPPPPGSATLDARIAVDPIPLRVQITCGKARDGVRPVSADITTPTTITLRMDTPEVTPDVCNRKPTRRGLPWWTLPLALTTGALAFN